MLLKFVSLASMAAQFAWMLYFLMGGLPLLILKHDDASDGRLVRGFFDVHYRVLMGISVVGVASALLNDRRLMAATIAVIGVVAFTARRLIVPHMDKLRETMHTADVPAIRTFRRLHMTGLALNLVLLSGFVFTLNRSINDIFRCADTPPGCTAGTCKVQCSMM